MKKEKIKNVLNEAIGTVTVGEFEHHVGRKPESQAEMDSFAHYWFKGMDAQLDFDIIGDCAVDAFMQQK